MCVGSTGLSKVMISEVMMISVMIQKISKILAFCGTMWKLSDDVSLMKLI